MTHMPELAGLVWIYFRAVPDLSIFDPVCVVVFQTLATCLACLLVLCVKAKENETEHLHPPPFHLMDIFSFVIFPPRAMDIPPFPFFSFLCLPSSHCFP